MEQSSRTAIGGTHGGQQNAQSLARELFQTAALLVADEEQAVSLVESALAELHIDPCSDSMAVAREMQPRLVGLALNHMIQMDPAGFSRPVSAGEKDAPCVETDDLSASGITREQLAGLMEGSGAGKLRQWMNRLPAALRAVFVLRAILGRDAAATAASLRSAGASGWIEADARIAYRQALCFVANELLGGSLPGSGLPGGGLVEPRGKSRPSSF